MPWGDRPSMAADGYPAPPQGSSPSFAHLFEFEMPNRYFDAVAGAQVFCQLLGQEHRSVLSAGAAEGHHQVLESASLVAAHASIHKRKHIGKILVHALLLVEIADDRLVLAGQRPELLF